MEERRENTSRDMLRCLFTLSLPSRQVSPSSSLRFRYEIYLCRWCRKVSISFDYADRDLWSSSSSLIVVDERDANGKLLESSVMWLLLIVRHICGIWIANYMITFNLISYRSFLLYSIKVMQVIILMKYVWSKNIKRKTRRKNKEKKYPYLF